MVHFHHFTDYKEWLRKSVEIVIEEMEETVCKVYIWIFKLYKSTTWYNACVNILKGDYGLVHTGVLPMIQA